MPEINKINGDPKKYGKIWKLYEVTHHCNGGGHQGAHS